MYFIQEGKGALITCIAQNAPLGYFTSLASTRVRFKLWPLELQTENVPNGCFLQCTSGANTFIVAKKRRCNTTFQTRFLVTHEALAYPQDLEGSDKSRNPLHMGMKISAEENRAGQCRAYRQHQGSASTAQPRNELITWRWRDNGVSEGSGVGSLSWTLADDRVFMHPEVWRHERMTEELKSVYCAGVTGLEGSN